MLHSITREFPGAVILGSDVLRLHYEVSLLSNTKLAKSAIWGASCRKIRGFFSDFKMWEVIQGRIQKLLKGRV